MNHDRAIAFITAHGDPVELARLRHLLNAHPAYLSAVTDLFAGQRPDGGFSPFWAPDYSSLDATCFRMAQAEQLGMTGGPEVFHALDEPSENATRASAFLAQHLQPDGSLPTFPHAHWLAAGLWHRVGEEELARGVMDYLATLLSGLPASNLAWLYLTLASAGAPSRIPLMRDAADGLARLQQEDGRWVSEDGPDRDTHATLEALRVMRHAGIE